MAIDENLVMELLAARRGGDMGGGAGMSNMAGGSALDMLMQKLQGGGGGMAPQGMGITRPPGGLNMPRPNMPPGISIGSMPEAGVDRSYPLPNPHKLKTKRGGKPLTPPGEGGTPYKDTNTKNQPKPKKKGINKNLNNTKENFAENIDDMSGMKKKKKKKEEKKEGEE